ncbi:MAG TPA: hypothetical protein VJS64_19890 [Pyrinomonadaceae bacterium]|nr:hypothetical protein [Pyrinomonadaceae bacterium]
MNRSAARIFEVYVFVYAALFASRPLSDGDFWWHLKTGEFIVKTNSIPRTDFFSFTNYGKPWVAHEWLSEVVFYTIYSRLGFNALILIFAVVTALAFWIALKRSTAHPFISGSAALLGVWGVLPTVGVRPRAFTLLLASVYLAILGRYARTGEGRAIWWLVPLMALWVNLHGGFLIGLVLIVLTIVGSILDAWVARESVRPLLPRLRQLSLVLVGAALAGCLNPHGWRIYLFPFEIFFSPIQQREVTDWLSPNFQQPELLPLVLLILVTIAALALSPRRPRCSELLFFLSTLYATLKSNRHMAIFALVAVPLMAEYLQSWISSTPLAKAFSKPTSAPASRREVFISLVLLLPLLLFANRLRTTAFSAPQQTMIQVPLQAVDYLKKNQVTGNTFSDPNIWGGYVIWALPNNPVYIDGRIDMYGDAFVKEYIDIIRGKIDWRKPFDRYAVKLAIVNTKSMLSREMQASPDWQMLYQDEMAMVFERR